MSWRRLAMVALSFAAALGISAWVVWTGWSKNGAPPLLPWWAHFAALGVVAVEVVARGFKMRLSALAIGVRLPLRGAIRVILGGDFAAAITPGRSGAEPARFLILAEAGLPSAAILLVLFVELALELVALTIVCTLLALSFREAGGAMSLLLGVIGGWIVLVGGSGGAGWFLSKHHAHGPPPGWARRLGFNAGAWRRVQRALRSLRASASSLRHARPSVLVGATFAAVVHVFARLAILVVVVRSVSPTTPVAPLVIWSLILLYGSSIAPAPGGGGAVEFSFKLALASVLTGNVLAGSLVWWRIYSFYVYLLLGALAAGSTVLRALRERPDEILAEAQPA
jgi:uncharacterized protein (TIRG00374 family)